MQEEHSFACPYCWQVNSVLLDLSAGGQEFIQDCEVCCNPIQFRYTVRGGAVEDIQVEDIGQ